MNIDEFGVIFYDADDVCELLYKNPSVDLSSVNIVNPDWYNISNEQTYAYFPTPKTYVLNDISIEEFDKANQSNWFMPDDYKTLDIITWIINQCATDKELDRCAEELLLYQEKDAIDVLRYSKYLVDMFRQNNIIWGLGRGSSVASFVLYKIGIHKINSLEYNIPLEEFFKN